ncbi:chemotaxis protein [Pseudomonas asiatica]|uniref:Chemotaxis protein n=1 Tax=Pseudomonas asiatica TaxID=2219225 RepID=A0ABU5KUI3_9PSED|nr:chemotaxis protein [Pseudomonas asiatica]MDZ5737600.1 chemotaxis protein [Pseudomonas asiatica]MDZ5745732.1 chemotaxis protein [Pseudomonas asiatica]MDZ5747830.1 chemotaxis protein [Pseudomonas asiatica]MDZ5752770.1 chemotaxis protein [Pseudomonas asiatica]
MDPTDLGPGTITWLGGTGTVLLGAFFWLRKWLSRDAADRAMDNADIGVVRRLNELLDIERDARREAQARADQFAKERNELVITVGRLEGKIEALTSRGGHPPRQVTVQGEGVARLRGKQGE